MQIARLPAARVYYLLVLSAFGDYFLLEKAGDAHCFQATTSLSNEKVDFFLYTD
jgi:hypothetical protein